MEGTRRRSLQSTVENELKHARGSRNDRTALKKNNVNTEPDYFDEMDDTEPEEFNRDEDHAEDRSGSDNEDEQDEDNDVDFNDIEEMEAEGLVSEDDYEDDSEADLNDDIVKRNECLESDVLRLISLAKHRNILQPFVTEKIFSLLDKTLEDKHQFEVLSNKETGRQLVAHLNQNVVYSQPASIVNCKLRDYQLEGLNWLIHQYHRRINCILGDEMGLGSKSLILNLNLNLNLNVLVS